MRHPRQAGVSLVTAVFLMVVLAALAAIMVKVGGVQRATTDLALQGARAYLAARGGIEWGIYRAVADQDCSAFPATLTYTTGGLKGFTAQLTCVATPHQERNNRFNVYVISAQGSFGTYGSLDYVSRTIEVKAMGPRP